ncbi:MAG: hypothetical protein Q7R33_04380 [Nitrosarchaeum sp.]|nr:hypothetical protein [Nitrosarchaeum sp.]
MKFNLPKNVEVEKISVTLTQDSDSCQSDDNGQSLIVETDDSGAGPYVILKTERWALDTEEMSGFVNLLKQIVTLAESKSLQ